MANQEDAQSTVKEQRMSMWKQLYKTEDYWAIWLAGLFFVVAVFCVLTWKPAVDKLPEYRSIMKEEMDKAGFRTIAYTEAEDAMDSIQAKKEGFTSVIYNLTNRPKGWTDNPLHSIYLSEEEAAQKRAAAADRFEEAKEELAQARAQAEEAEATAAAANFQNKELNQKAKAAINKWRQAKSSYSSAKSDTNTQPYNLIPSLLVLGIVIMLFFAIGARFIGISLREFFKGFPVIFALACLAYLISNQATLKAVGLSYVLFALALGLIISNTLGVPKWVKQAGQTEFFIKTGLVLLGARILIGQIALIGIPGIFVTWVVTPIVLISTFWFGQRVIKMPSKELNITISSDMCVSGVSAAIASASASGAKKEELTLSIGMSMIFVAVMIFLLPAIANITGMHPVWAGAWLGGTVDNTGSVVAAGELIGMEAMYVAATIKMIQNVMIGVIAFGVAAYWCLRVEPQRACQPGQTPMKLSAGGALMEVWYRFPKFILGFIGASIIFSLMQTGVNMDWGQAMVNDGILAMANRFRGWFFCLAFVSIGLSINYRELKEPLRGGKPLILYVCGQTLNLLLTLFMAWLMFMVIFRDITDMLMAGA